MSVIQNQITHNQLSIVSLGVIILKIISTGVTVRTFERGCQKVPEACDLRELLIVIKGDLFGF